MNKSIRSIVESLVTEAIDFGNEVDTSIDSLSTKKKLIVELLANDGFSQGEVPLRDYQMMFSRVGVGDTRVKSALLAKSITTDISNYLNHTHNVVVSELGYSNLYELLMNEFDDGQVINDSKVQVVAGNYGQIKAVSVSTGKRYRALLFNANDRDRVVNTVINNTTRQENYLNIAIRNHPELKDEIDKLLNTKTSTDDSSKSNKNDTDTGLSFSAPPSDGQDDTSTDENSTDSEQGSSSQSSDPMDFDDSLFDFDTSLYDR